MFPLDLGGFHQLLSMRPSLTLAKQGILQPDYFSTNADPNHASPFLGAEADYLSADGDKFLVEIVRAQSDSTAFSLFTIVAKKLREGESGDLKTGDVGTASVATARSVTFFKGTTFARVTNENGSNPEPAIALARLFAATFDKGEDDIPVLVKHLPDWQTTRRNSVYAVNIGPLRDSIPNQAVLDALNFDGGTEAVTATYGPSQLVIVEFTTPQFASDNDRRITAKIQELKNQGQPVPTGYRRLGNYSVFVFNAPDEKTANALIDQVKYEQVVQWLGDDPHLYERVQRYVLQKTSGVVIAVLESSGLSVLLCLGMGGLFGALLFRWRRRARQRQGEAYSDAGGMIRLNLDEVTESDAVRLLEGSHKRG
ncbi:MAG TPA: DUF6599 family protein [Pyrinomonadaceae bacterium]|nr:DUF6599 family protein [Pyrinomonadaceae bacterium]